ISFFYDLYIYRYPEFTYYLLSACIASGFFLLLYLVSQGKWIGMGDVKYGVFMGFFLGWPNVLVGLFLAYVIGAAVGVILLFFKKKGLKSEIPFGPFLIVGTLLAYFFGDYIVKWYIGTII
ncbi:prepilin peptidase, partial [Candidatus Azambacteria bacterium]|nr:prepilin peptidase [Candidatus Azambacteria bacterium]